MKKKEFRMHEIASITMNCEEKERGREREREREEKR